MGAKTWPLDFLQPEFCCLTKAEYWSDLTGFIIELNQETSDNRVKNVNYSDQPQSGEYKTDKSIKREVCRVLILESKKKAKKYPYSFF